MAITKVSEVSDLLTQAGQQPQESFSTIASPGDAEPDRRSFKERVLEFERRIITEALAETGGRVTPAARSLGLTHQGLCYLINCRHPDLLALRRPIRIRRRSIIPKDKLRRV